MKLVRRLLFAGLAAGLVLVLSELALRAFALTSAHETLLDTDRDLTGYFDSDPQLGWRMHPGAYPEDPILRDWEARWGTGADASGEVPTNHRGFRDEELPREPPEGQARVMLLGDSSAWGSGVRRRDSFACRLERLLNPQESSPRPVEVINAATPGYSTYQAIVTLERNLDLHPQGIVVYNMISDFGLGRGTRDDVFYHDWANRHVSFLGKLALFNTLRELLELRMASPAQGDQVRVTFDHYRENLESLVRIARQHEAWLVFVVPPVLEDLSPRSSAGDLDFQVRNAAEAQAVRNRLAGSRDRDSPMPARGSYRCAMSLVGWEHDVPVLDAPGYFRTVYFRDPQDFQGRDALFVDQVHPSARGHALLARLLLPALRERLYGQQ